MSEPELVRPERLDLYVLEKLKDISRSSVAKIIENGLVLVNNEVQLKPGYRLRLNDKVVIKYNPDKQAPIKNIKLDVIYEDDNCVVIDKPIGVLSHSKGAFNPEATIASWNAKRTRQLSGDRAGIVHRLDRLTSGVMILAKTTDSLKWLQKQFSARKTKKTYIAVIKGQLENPEAIIDMPIERNPKKPQTFRVGVNGKQASTLYKVLKSNDQYSLIELKPTTGRTHQLRVHLKQLGHPILGDPLYGGAKANRLYLHAHKLELTLPNKERKVFTSSLPKEFNEIMT